MYIYNKINTYLPYKGNIIMIASRNNTTYIYIYIYIYYYPKPYFSITLLCQVNMPTCLHNVNEPNNVLYNGNTSKLYII